MRRPLALLTALATAALGAAVVSSPTSAGAADLGAEVQIARGDVRSGDAFHLVYSGKVGKGLPDTQATGTFVGELTTGGQVVRFAGPITCLHVSGSSVGFFYPVEESEPDVVATFGAGVFIYVDSDGLGSATAFTFLPSPAATTDGCAPAPGTTPATGSARTYVGPDTVLSGPATQFPFLGAPVTLTGTAKPGAVVDVFARKRSEASYVRRRSVRAGETGAWTVTFVPTQDTNVFATSGIARSTTKALLLAPTISGPAVVVVPKGSSQVLRGRGLPGTVVNLAARTSASKPGVFPLHASVLVRTDGTWSRPFTANRAYEFAATRLAGQVPARTTLVLADPALTGEPLFQP